MKTGIVCHQGSFVGFSRSDGQYLIFYNGRVRSAITVIRLATTLKWDAGLMQSVSATPYDQHVAPQPEVIFKPDETAKDMQVRLDERTIARKVYIRQEDLLEFGYTR